VKKQQIKTFGFFNQPPCNWNIVRAPSNTNTSIHYEPNSWRQLRNITVYRWKWRYLPTMQWPSWWRSNGSWIYINTSIRTYHM